MPPCTPEGPGVLGGPKGGPNGPTEEPVGPGGPGASAESARNDALMYPIFVAVA